METSPSLFKEEKTLNAILYVAYNKGGKTDVHELANILYLADRRHLSEYGRSITGDTYIAKKHGPVPSCTDDILKAVRENSYFSYAAKDLKAYLHFIDDNTIVPDKHPYMDCLSESDVECLNYAIAKCKDLSFGALTELSHGFAWHSVALDNPIPIRQILFECGDTYEYADFIENQQELQKQVNEKSLHEVYR